MKIVIRFYPEHHDQKPLEDDGDVLLWTSHVVPLHLISL